MAYYIKLQKKSKKSNIESLLDPLIQLESVLSQFPQTLGLPALPLPATLISQMFAKKEEPEKKKEKKVVEEKEEKPKQRRLRGML